MKFMVRWLCGAMILANGYGAVEKTPPPAAEPVAPPRIEVCFVLDTTGSMSGLIEGAKRKIWSIANEIASAKPAPVVKFGLIGYRDRGDDYITRVYPLTEDLDAIYEKLQAFRAGGGGDGPESVNQALHEAVTQMQWSEDRAVLKVIFLVGDAPPHMDYEDDVKYPETLELAVKRDLILNTVQCGGDRSTTEVWKDIAARGEGRYTAIEQSGAMAVVSTPMDAELARVQAELGRLEWGYGDKTVRQRRDARMAVAASAPAPEAADRASYMLKAGEARRSAVVAGGVEAADAMAEAVEAGSVDLLSAIESKAMDVDKLEREKLPEELQDLTPEQRQAAIDERLKQRQVLQAKLGELARQRDAHLAAEAAKAPAAAPTGFDAEVSEAIREQAGRKGIAY